MSKSKKQGTDEETWLVRELRSLALPARRLAEGGRDDEGDVEVTVGNERMILESKAAERISIHTVLAKAIQKAGDVPAAVVWKRLERPYPEAKRRVSRGRVVALQWATFARLLRKAAAADRMLSDDELDHALDHNDAGLGRVEDCPLCQEEL